MRFQARKVERVTVREQWRRDRAAAQTLRDAFPYVARIHFHLFFEDPAGASPASQSHVLHPPARAFFEFPCPYANCDGRFDLSTPVRDVSERGSLQITGNVRCAGSRSKGALAKQLCDLRLMYTIAAEFLMQANAGK